MLGGRNCLGRSSWVGLPSEVWKLDGTRGLRPVSPCSPSPEASLQDKMAAKQPPPLMKKHSQTDLVSRLKTRKILGVGGEDDDGEVHRSKVGSASEELLGGEGGGAGLGHHVAKKSS